ncbi:MAG TPA: hypothetical protein VFH50_02260 [Acidimicrobiales bacterium]|nr:hypothetical protein [Acidimicrobiales bacterium]
MEPIRWLGLVAGALLLASGASSVLYTLVLPRAHPSRLTEVATRVTLRFGRWLGDRFSTYEAKDHVLALMGPMALLGAFGLWLAAFFLGYSLILWPLLQGGLPTALRAAGSAMLTLGLATARGGGDLSVPATVVSFVAAGTGLGIVALEIAYLPTIYGAFNRRETLVTLLQSRAGSPAWGPEILARHQLVGISDNLPAFFASWEQWAADVAETHTTYPVLVLFRSPHALRSWIVGLLAVLDSAALHLALSPSAAPSEARLCLRMGFRALQDIAPAWGMTVRLDPRPDDPVVLTYEEFLQGVERMREAGVTLERSVEEAWVHFRGWRVNYEAPAYFLGELVTAAPGPWAGPRRRIGILDPDRPLDRTPDDPDALRGKGGRWLGPSPRAN